MTILHKGIRRKTTDVLADYSQAHYLQNVRFKRVGELGRRAGLGKSTMAQLAGPVQFMIGCWSNESFIVNGTGGDVSAEEDPLPLWSDNVLVIPIGAVGQGTPQPPVINFMVSVPGEGVYGPAPYPVFVVTPNITYDGLSGPLTYLWELINVVDATPVIADPTASVCTCDASGSGDGVFEVQLTVTASFNPLMTDQSQTTTYTLIP